MNDDTRFYVSWTDDKPVLKRGKHGMETAQQALRHALRGERSRQEKAAERLALAEVRLRRITALAAEHGGDPDAPSPTSTATQR